MSLASVYSYADAAGYRKYADDNDVVFTGTWSSSGSYYASAMQVVDYGQSQYLAITDNANQNPTIQPTKWKPTRYWSSFVLLVPATGTASGTVPGGNLAFETLPNGNIIAVEGGVASALFPRPYDTASGTASEALSLAESSTAMLSTGWAGTVSVWAAGSQGGPTHSQLVFVNGILTAYVP